MFFISCRHGPMMECAYTITVLLVSVFCEVLDQWTPVERPIAGRTKRVVLDYGQAELP